MKCCLNRIVACCLSAVLLLSLFPVAASASDIYDETSLIAALNSGGEITLWQDITAKNALYVNEDVTLDLNGYKLTANNGIVVSANKTLTIRDRQYTEANPGEGSLNVSEGVAISNATLILESGTVYASGPENGQYGVYSTSITQLGLGIGGDNATIIVRGGIITAIGGNGKKTEWTNQSSWFIFLGNGGAGIGGKNASITILGGKVNAFGGRGWDASSGGLASSIGGPGISCPDGSFVMADGTVIAQGCNTISNASYDEVTGFGGAGIAANNASIEVKGGWLFVSGATGSAAIGGSRPVYYYVVTPNIAYNVWCAEYNDYYGINGANVSISGGSVVAQGGGGAFDIGGGIGDDGSVGLGGTLTVTGGSLEFCTNGRATNVTDPVFQNCVVCGSGAYQHEGTYSEDGKFTVEVTSLELDHDAGHAGENVALTANVTVSRTSGISVPAPKGRIVFACDGETIGQAPIENAATGEGYVTAKAALAWTAEGGAHAITAVYVPGENDRYAPSDNAISPVACDYEEHSYQGVISVDPTTTSEGSLLCTCSVCAGTATVTLPVLDEQSYTYEVVNPASCSATGTGRYTWKETAYGIFSFDVVLPFADHDYSETVVPPTCIAQGYTEYVCANCGASYRDHFTDLLGHTFIYAVTEAPTKTESGVLTGACSVCGSEVTITIPRLNEDDYTYSLIKPASCTAKGTERYTWKNTAYGTFFFDLTLEMLPHSYVGCVTAPTCTERGYTTYTCSVCGSSYVDQYVDALGHSCQSSVTAPTCTETGYTTYTCSRCGDSYRSDVTAALGHTPGAAVEENRSDPSCTESGGFDTAIYCTTCGEEISRVHTDLAALGHEWDGGVISPAPSCTANGVKTYTCLRCGEKRTEAVSATGHLPGEAERENEIAATCTTIGGYDMVVRCTTCHAILYNEHFELPALGHDYQSVITASTCTSGGSTTHMCSRCGDSYTDSYVPALGHTPGEPLKENEAVPTCAEPGGYDTVVYCTVCGEELSRENTELAALGHDYVDGVCTRCGAVDPDNPPDDPKPNNPFTDIVEGAYYYDAVLWAVNTTPQITAGTSATTFSPNDGCTRAQVVTFLWRAAGAPEPTITSNPFTDVIEGTYYTKAVLWAVENGITAGTAADKFSPDVTCTRGQIVTFLWRYEDKPEPGTAVNPFTDVKPGAYYETAVLWAAGAGVTAGTSATTFSPDTTCTRGQVVTFLYRDMTQN